ncbi:chitinase [Sinorhizobium phage phiN3]|uniref:Chitinase n=1 Tax=Sinorhizobium phage phiN3 TaxID=1647405 RepID=A0A0F6YPI2_9CAUD|nr:endolysin [Sinorhizobium phage phiN3]AKF13579.1 chitinase [Sinorhizobium phage phiN3]
MDRKKFFDAIRDNPLLFNGRLSSEQVVGISAILNRMEKLDARWLAYALATAFHETGGRMVPIMENLNYSAKGLRATFPKYFNLADAAKYERKPQAIANRAYGNRMGNGPEASGDGWLMRGRGLVQLTGRDNYRKYGIENNPDKALEPDFAVAIMFDGMTSGAYTGKKLSDYFNDTKTDWVGARRIINGTDKAEKIAGEAKAFYAAIIAAK